MQLNLGNDRGRLSLALISDSRVRADRREGTREESLELKMPWVTTCLHGLSPLSSPPSQLPPPHLEGVMWASYKGIPLRRGGYLLQYRDLL